MKRLLPLMLAAFVWLAAWNPTVTSADGTIPTPGPTDPTTKSGGTIPTPLVFVFFINGVPVPFVYFG